MKVCSLFAGIGGIDIAFAAAGFSVVWANEVDSSACKTYRLNIPDAALAEGDIRKISKSDIPDFDVLTAGFPCQPFSVCGKQEGFRDDRGNLFFQIIDTIDAKNPEVVFLENVANLVEHDKGRTFNVIHNELVSRGYLIRYLIADACDYGIPQHRTRTYISAFKSESACGRFEFPDKIPLEKHIFDLIDKSRKANDIYYLQPDSEQYRRMSEAITDENQIYRFSDYGIQKSKDGISFTLKANMGTWRDRVPIIKDDFGIRKITPYECLALQGFLDGFKFPGCSMTQAYKQCGNTVVVPLVTQIAKRIAESI